MNRPPSCATRPRWRRDGAPCAGRGGGGKLRFFRLRDPGGQAQVEATILKPRLDAATRLLEQALADAVVGLVANER